MISKFYEGGIVTGPSGRDNVLAMVTAGEYVMPVEQTARYRGELDAMRSGRYEGIRPSFIAGDSGGSGDNVTVQVSIAEGGLLMADDELAVRRLGETIHEVIEDKIKPNYKE